MRGLDLNNSMSDIVCMILSPRVCMPMELLIKLAKGRSSYLSSKSLVIIT